MLQIVVESFLAVWNFRQALFLNNQSLKLQISYHFQEGVKRPLFFYYASNFVGNFCICYKFFFWSCIEEFPTVFFYPRLALLHISTFFRLYSQINVKRTTHIAVTVWCRFTLIRILSIRIFVFFITRNVNTSSFLFLGISNKIFQGWSLEKRIKH